MRLPRSLALLLLVLCLLPWGSYSHGLGTAAAPSPPAATAAAARTAAVAVAGAARKCRTGLPGDCAPDRFAPAATDADATSILASRPAPPEQAGPAGQSVSSRIYRPPRSA